MGGLIGDCTGVLDVWIGAGDAGKEPDAVEEVDAVGCILSADGIATGSSEKGTGETDDIDSEGAGAG